MFNRKKTLEQIALEKEIASLHSSLDGLDIVDDKENYQACRAEIEKLHALLANYQRELVNPNTLITTAGSLLGVLSIINYERLHVFASKAYAHVPKVR